MKKEKKDKSGNNKNLEREDGYWESEALITFYFLLLP